MRRTTIFLAMVLTALVFWGANVQAAEISIDVNCTMKPGGAEEAAINKFMTCS